MSSTHDGADGLEALRRRLERWRRRHGGPGKRIPEPFWEEAAAIAHLEGIEEVARALRLDARGLARRAALTPAQAEPCSAAPTAFVELAAAELSVPERSAVEVVNAAGERLRIELSGRVDVEALVRGFCGRGGCCS